MLLKKSQHRINNQKRAHHGKIRMFSEHGGQHHDQFKRPSGDAPELSQEVERRMPLLLRHLVVAVRLASNLHLSVREAGAGVHAGAP